MPSDRKTIERFAREVTRGTDPSHREGLARAFAAVRREDHLPPPPWLAGSGLLGGMRHTRETDDLYRNVLVAIDPDRRINNGQPSLWAEMLSLVEAPGDCRHVLHSGCGLGYYTAVMAHYFEGATVEFDEAEADLMKEATMRLAGLANVRPRRRDTLHDAILLSYGICRIAEPLIAQMGEGCQLIAPVTGAGGRGQVVHFRRHANRLEVQPAMAVAFITDSSMRGFPSRIEPREMRIEIGQGEINLVHEFSG